MANSVALNVALLVLATMLIAGPYAEAAITCDQIATSLSPCTAYLQGSGPLPVQCCSGVRSLNATATTTPDRRTACGCLKQMATSTQGIILSLAAGLPGNCGVDIGYPISLSVDCSKIK